MIYDSHTILQIKREVRGGPRVFSLKGISGALLPGHRRMIKTIP
jgi:hypothetical protein